jgi:hypothetical protein
MSGRRRSRIFRRRRGQRQHDGQHNGSVKRGASASQHTSNLEFTRPSGGGLQRVWPKALAFFAMEKKEAQLPSKKDKVSKLASDEVSSNPPSPITEPSIIGSSPSRPTSVPGYHNQWPGSASITVGMNNSSQPMEQVFGGATTHGQPNTARGW